MKSLKSTLQRFSSRHLAKAQKRINNITFELDGGENEHLKDDNCYSQEETANDGQEMLAGVHLGDVIDNDENVRVLFNLKCKEIFALIKRNIIIMYTFTGGRRRKHTGAPGTGGIPQWQRKYVLISY